MAPRLEIRDAHSGDRARVSPPTKIAKIAPFGFGYFSCGDICTPQLQLKELPPPRRLTLTALSSRGVWGGGVGWGWGVRAGPAWLEYGLSLHL